MTTKESIFTPLKSNKPRLEKLGVRNVGLFGSYLRSEQTGESDIDILLDFDPVSENFDYYMEACNLFDELFENEKVEVIDKG